MARCAPNVGARLGGAVRQLVSSVAERADLRVVRCGTRVGEHNVVIRIGTDGRDVPKGDSPRLTVVFYTQSCHSAHGWIGFFRRRFTAAAQEMANRGELFGWLVDPN